MIRKENYKKNSKRAAIIVWTAVSVTALVGFTTLVVDLGSLRVVKSQLQNAADASAMAGASALLDPGKFAGPLTDSDLAANARNRAILYASKNNAENKSLCIFESDATVGHLSDVTNLAQPISFETPYNAIKVNIVKDENSPNGPAKLYFASIWGKQNANLSASATAYLDGRMSAFKVDSRKAKCPLIPVSVRREKWESEIVNQNGLDGYGFNLELGQVTEGPDGIKEISLFPEKQKADGTSDGAGDFGLLHIGNANQGATLLGNQISNGLTEEDVIGQFGSDEIKMYDDAGNHLSYTIDGTPGAKNSLVQLEDNFRSRLGEVIGFFIHDTVTQSGANSQYTVTDIQFGRILMINAQGSVSGQKVIVIQPVAYMGNEIITDGKAQTHTTAGRVRLVR